jgi:hypothetical protein
VVATKLEDAYTELPRATVVPDRNLGDPEATGAAQVPQLKVHGRRVLASPPHIAVEAIDATGWRAEACTIPAVTGAGGAIEAFVLARRTPSAQGTS